MRQQRAGAASINGRSHADFDSFIRLRKSRLMSLTIGPTCRDSFLQLIGGYSQRLAPVAAFAFLAYIDALTSLFSNSYGKAVLELELEGGVPCKA